MCPSDMSFDEEFEPNLSGSEQEREWIRQSLSEFFDDKLIRDVLYRVNGGKEANVYCCQAEPDTGFKYLAAKVFRPRKFRAMKNDWFYKQGRSMIDPEGKAVYDGRGLRAIKQHSRHGRQIDMASWCLYEYNVLAEFHEAGADVPEPIGHAPNAILMEYVGDITGPAPALHAVRPEPDEARHLFHRLLRNVDLMLGCYKIHADLSAHNVLYWEGRATIIDVPQAVDMHRVTARLMRCSPGISSVCANISPNRVCRQIQDA